MMLRCAIALVFLLCPVAARAEWSRATSSHFIVYGNLRPDQTRDFTEKLERFDTVLRTLNNPKDTETTNKLTVFVVRDASVVQQQLGADGHDVLGFYSPLITGALAFVPRTAGEGGQFDLDSETVLFHEYTHHFMLQHFAVAYPAWFVEGYAEYLSTTDFRAHDVVAIGLPAKHRFYDLVNGNPFTVRRMMTADPGRLNREDTARFYAWGWLLTHYLEFDQVRNPQFVRYIDAYAKGVDPMKAATEAFGDLDAMQKDLERYSDATRLHYIQRSGIKFPAYAIDVVALDATESAMMPLYLRFARGSHGERDARSYVEEARRIAKRFPGNPRALELLAEGEVDTGNFDAATVANDALLAVHPGDERALYRRSEIAAKRLGDSRDAGGWKAVRQLVIKANRAAPDDPLPLLAYYQTYQRAGIAPPKIAIDGLWRAVELAPQVAELRFALAEHLLTQHERRKAEYVLAPLINDPHSAEVRDRARKMLGAQNPPELPTAAKKAS